MSPGRIVACLLTLLWVAEAHHHVIPVPYPYPVGSYRHTSSVVNVPVYHDKMIIIQKPGNHHHHDGYAHDHGHAYSHRQEYHHGQHSYPSHARIANYHSNEAMSPAQPAARHYNQPNHYRWPSHGDSYSLNGMYPPSVYPQSRRPTPGYYDLDSAYRYPYFEDISFLLDPSFRQQSVDQIRIR